MLFQTCIILIAYYLLHANCVVYTTTIFFIAKSACIIMWCFCLHSCGFVTHQQSHAERKHVGRHNMLGNKYSTISHILVMFFPVGNTAVHSPHRVLELTSLELFQMELVDCVCVCVCVCVCSFSGNSEVRSITGSQRRVKHSLIQNHKHKGIFSNPNIC